MLDFENIYKNFRRSIPCKECSICCQKAGNIVLLPEESRFLVKKVPQAEKYVYRKKVDEIDVELIKLPCPFLKDSLCSIEENKPLDCRFYPLDYCLFNNKVIIIASKSCPTLKEVSGDNKKIISKEIVEIINKAPKNWLKSAILFGPCGGCNKKSFCELAEVEGYNDKEW